jgi:hypothetical protein
MGLPGFQARKGLLLPEKIAKIKKVVHSEIKPPWLPGLGKRVFHL